jgi:exosortase A
MSRITAYATAAQPVVQRWAAACCALVAVAAALCALFPVEAAGALHVWLTSTAYNHCFLIVPVALYLAWQRRDALIAHPPKPDPRPLVVILPLSLLWLVAASVSVLEAQQFVIMTMFQVAAVSLVGIAAYRALLTPFLYLFFLVPSGYVLVPYLQDFTAHFIVRGLEFLDIPTYWDGTIIEVPSGNFVVAEACAGLRFLIASIAFGVLFATIMYKSYFRRTIFIALSIVVPIIANGFRALGLIVLSEMAGSATMVMADHILYGWLFFSLVTLLLIVIGVMFSDTVPDAHASFAPSPYAASAGPWRYAAIAAASLVLAGAGPAYAQFRDWRALPLPESVAAPAVSAPWRPDTTADATWQPLILAPDHAFRDAFSDDGATVMRYLALYRTGGLHDNLVRSTNEIADPKVWNLASHGTATVRVDGRDVTVASTEIEREGRRLLVWSFYALGDTIIASPLEAKLAELRGLVGRRSLSAFLAVATDETGGAAQAQHALQNFLDGMTPIGRYLDAISPS